MKFIVSIVHNEDARALVTHLAEAGFRPTLINSTESFLYGNRALVLFGSVENSVDTAVKIIQKTCKKRARYDQPLPPPTEAGEMFLVAPNKRTIGGATVFVLDSEQFFKF